MIEMIERRQGFVHEVLHSLAMLENKIRPPGISDGEIQQALIHGLRGVGFAAHPDERQWVVEALAPLVSKYQFNSIEVFASMLLRVPSQNEFDAIHREEPLDVLWGVLNSFEWGVSFAKTSKHQIGHGKWRYLVHIPKTAGSKLQQLLLDGEWGPEPQASVRLPTAANEAPLDVWRQAHFLKGLLSSAEPRVVVSGHVSLLQMNPLDVYSPTDEILTVVREPIDQMLSWVKWLYLRQSRGDSIVFQGATEGAFSGTLSEACWKDVLLAVAERSAKNFLAPSRYFGGSLEALAIHLRVGHVRVLEHSTMSATLRKAGLREQAIQSRVNESAAGFEIDALSPWEVASLSQSLAGFFAQHRICIEHAAKYPIA